MSKKKEYPYDHPKGMPGDKRHVQWAKQRKERGFDSRELWSLDSTLARHIHPRLVAFREADLFVRAEEFHKKLDEAILIFKWLGEEDRWACSDEKQWKRVSKALRGFADIYLGLWT